MKYSLDGVAPNVHRECFVAPGASIIGDVNIKAYASIWFNAVIRADSDKVTIGESTNIQDGAVLHCDPGFPLLIGDGVTVGHKAAVHGCSIDDYSLIGISAVILNGAKIGKHCLIGANALVPENMDIPDGSLVVGSPAKILRQLSDEQRNALEQSAKDYSAKGKKFKQTLTAQE